MWPCTCCAWPEKGSGAASTGVVSGTTLVVALALMLLNMIDGYHRTRRAIGLKTGLVVTAFYFIVALYVVLAMTTYKMHANPRAPAASPHIPLSIFR